MQRTIKFGLYGLVLAGLLGGTASWATESGKTVSLRIDGQDRQVHTTAADVRGVLDAAHIAVGEHDLIAPELGSTVADGAAIVVRRGHQLHLVVNGAARDVWVNATSVDEALNQLGYGSQNLVSVSRSKRLETGPLSLAVTSPKLVTFTVDHKSVPVAVFGPTLREALAQAHLRLGAHDLISPKITTAVRDRQVVTIHRVVLKLSTETQKVPFATVRKSDSTRTVGSSALVTAGRTGLSKVTYQLRYVDGKLVSKVRYTSKAVRKPVTQVTEVGTKPKPVYSGPVSSGSAQQIAAGMVSARGWSGDQFSCLVSLWNKESGWRTNAANPSGAYGIPQALPGSKMASAGSDWQTSAATQIRWGLGYIASVYGSPCSAWAHSQATNWY